MLQSNNKCFQAINKTFFYRYEYLDTELFDCHQTIFTEIVSILSQNDVNLSSNKIDGNDEIFFFNE